MKRLLLSMTGNVFTRLERVLLMAVAVLLVVGTYTWVNLVVCTMR